MKKTKEKILGLIVATGVYQVSCPIGADLAADSSQAMKTCVVAAKSHPGKLAGCFERHTYDFASAESCMFYVKKIISGTDLADKEFRNYSLKRCFIKHLTNPIKKGEKNARFRF